MSHLTYDAKEYTVQDIIHRHQNGVLNLEPGFQRRSVWQDSDRRKLIDSIVRGYPLPAVFFYKRHEGGRTYYDVIDGKQRLETILMFAGEMRGQRFAAKLQLSDDERPEEVDWRKLVRLGKQRLISDYTLSIIEVDGELSEVIDLFIRINSTGKSLTSAEKQHARYYSNSPFFKAAASLAEKMVRVLRENGIMSDAQVSRMKHIQLISELMLSVYRGGPVHKKDALDAVMGSGEMNARQIKATVDGTKSAIKRALAILPNIRTTRFRKISDFYSLVVLVAQFESKKFALADRRRAKQSGEILTALSTGVDELNLKRRRMETVEPGESLYRDYLMTVLEGTDSYPSRKRRQEILNRLLEPIFEKLDNKRLFTPEQRRILWNSTDEKKCSNCRRALTWADFTIDHINPFSKGGRTALANAAIFCRGCNSSKGNRGRRGKGVLRRRRAA